jgi:hypothetical protein
MLLLGYIDAGSGTMLLQVLLAGVVAIPFFFRRVIGDTWHRLRGGRSSEATAETTTRKTEE